MVAKSKYVGTLSAAAGALVAVGLLTLMMFVVEVRPAEATFPGQNGNIAYVSNDRLASGGYTDSEIFTIKPTRGTPVPVTNNDTSDGNPSYLPDGTKIAYSGWDGNDWEIYKIGATGGTPYNVTDNTTNESNPSYSPDGTKIAYVGSDGNDAEIFTIDAAGGTPFQVTHNDLRDLAPDYSPDGEKIAYESCLIPVRQLSPDRYCGYSGGFDEGEYSEIFTINATGGTPLRLTNNKTHDESPSYKPNGNKIAYSGQDGPNGDFEIYKINALGGTPVPVTNNDTSDREPSYSPNGRKIAYSGWDGNDAEIYKIDQNGGTPVPVTNNSNSSDWSPSWGKLP